MKSRLCSPLGRNLLRREESHPERHAHFRSLKSKTPEPLLCLGCHAQPQRETHPHPTHSRARPPKTCRNPRKKPHAPPLAQIPPGENPLGILHSPPMGKTFIRPHLE